MPPFQRGRWTQAALARGRHGIGPPRYLGTNPTSPELLDVYRWLTRRDSGGIFVNAPVLGSQYPGKTEGHLAVESIDSGGNGGIAYTIQPGLVRATQVFIVCRVAPPKVLQQPPGTLRSSDADPDAFAIPPQPVRGFRSIGMARLDLQISIQAGIGPLLLVRTTRVGPRSLQQTLSETGDVAADQLKKTW